jgi:hypothetical protein
LIKVPVPPEFLLEWFLKSLVPQLSKDVAMSGVFSEEDAIMRAQQLELIYSQSGLLYEILPDAPRSILDKTRQRVGPHADGIVGSTQAKTVDPLSKQLQQLSIQQTTASQTTGPGCSPYPNVGCTQRTIDKPEGQPAARWEEETMKEG